MTTNTFSPPCTEFADRAPLDIAFALDRSGSMQWQNKLRLMQDAVLAATYHLSSRDRIALVVFNNEVEVVLDLIHATDSGKRRMEQVIDSVEVLDGTNLSRGWITACQLLANDEVGGASRVQLAVVLTDGFANRGETEPGKLFAYASGFHHYGISTTTIGVGPLFDECLLSGIAGAGGGAFTHIDRTSAALDFFEQEIDHLIAAGGAIPQRDRTSL